LPSRISRLEHVNQTLNTSVGHVYFSEYIAKRAAPHPQLGARWLDEEGVPWRKGGESDFVGIRRCRSRCWLTFQRYSYVPPLSYSWSSFLGSVQQRVIRISCHFHPEVSHKRSLRMDVPKIANGSANCHVKDKPSRTLCHPGLLYPCR
jgi:hypothetical protein